MNNRLPCSVKRGIDDDGDGDEHHPHHHDNDDDAHMVGVCHLR